MLQQINMLLLWKSQPDSMTHPFCYNEITAKTARGSCSAPRFRTFDHLRLNRSNHLILNVFGIARTLETSACIVLWEHRLRLFPVLDFLQTVRSVPASPRCHVRFTRRTTSRRFCGLFLTWSRSVVFSGWVEQLRTLLLSLTLGLCAPSTEPEQLPQCVSAASCRKSAADSRPVERVRTLYYQAEGSETPGRTGLNTPALKMIRTLAVVNQNQFYWSWIRLWSKNHSRCVSPALTVNIKLIIKLQLSH